MLRRFRGLLLLSLLMVPCTAQTPLKTVSAASLLPGPVAREMLVVSTGAGLAGVTASFRGDDPGAELGGTTVKLLDAEGHDGFAGLIFVSPARVVWVVPDWPADGVAKVIITAADGTTSEGGITVAVAAPGLFAAENAEKPYAAASVARLSAEGASEPVVMFVCSSPGNLCLPAPFDPAGPGEAVVTLLATGIRRAANLSLRIGGEDLEVRSRRKAAGQPGVDEIEVAIPAAFTGRGDVEAVLTTDGVDSNAVLLAIGPAPHLVAEIRPNSIQSGQPALDWEAAGDRLSDVRALRFYPPDGISVADLQASERSVRARLTVSAAAAPGRRVAVLESERGRSNPFSITLQTPLPKIATLTPDRAAPGTTVEQFRITGEALAAVNRISFDPPAGITVTGLSASENAVTAAVAVAADAADGIRAVSVTSPGGVSAALPFTVLRGPRLTSLNPATAPAGLPVNLTVTGTDLAGITSLRFSPSAGVTVTAVRATATQATTTVYLSSLATPGVRQVSVSGPQGTSNSLAFTIDRAPDYDGTWSGLTSGNLPLAFTVRDRKIISYSISYRLSSFGSSGCTSAMNVFAAGLSIAINSSSFSESLTGGLRGSFSSEKAAKGSFSAWPTSVPGSCAPGLYQVSWTATKQ
ncbi:MAG: hypothetical protein Q8N47_02970 [Bryobacterales bacterium]|nr:hypothetical protein [Bryobacterales bacterium]